MFCPKCRAEFVAGVLRCGNCEVPLLADLPPEDDFASPESMARLLKDRELEAVVVGNYVALSEQQRLLAKERIPSVIAGEAATEIEAGLHARLFLMVEAERLGEIRAFFEKRWARGLAAEGIMLAKDLAAHEGTCPACGAAMPADVAECPECGLFLGDPDAPA
ncbi:MAG: hypothetical protein HY903_10505 [Deltaproteobacteria bacterium]|nr:hypothetical protein [Deltaproteobacteria bacterium]